MEVSVLQRVNCVVEDLGKTKNYFANEIGMSSTTTWRQLKGEQALSAKLIEGLLLAYPNVSAEWLLRGKGSMLLEDTDGFAKPQNETSQQKPSQDDGIWQAKYEELEKRYDQLLSILGGTMGKRNVG